MKRKIIQLLLKWGFEGLAWNISPYWTVYYLGKRAGAGLAPDLRKDIWKD